MDIKVILAKHQLWLQGKPGGERANLHGINLREADLSGADLCRAILNGVDLRSESHLVQASDLNANNHDELVRNQPEEGTKQAPRPSLVDESNALRRMGTEG